MIYQQDIEGDVTALSQTVRKNIVNASKMESNVLTFVNVPSA